MRNRPQENGLGDTLILEKVKVAMKLVRAGLVHNADVAF